MKTKVCAVGGINIDLVTETNKVPKIGETVIGTSFATYPGGKGGNQAVAASRLGADTFIVGCLGSDLFGKELIDGLTKNGVNTDHVKILEGETTGIATITVCEGDNSIVLCKGANNRNSVETVSECIDEIINSDVILLQNEIPMEVNRYIMEKAENKAKIIYNPAPYMPVPKEILKYLTVLVVNEHECSDISGKRVETLEEAKEAALEIHSWGVKNVIITMGKMGAVYNDGDTVHEIKARKVKAVDTTAAGDTFCGAIAVCLSQLPISKAVQYANLAASITVTKKGAQTSIPSQEEVRKLMDN